MWMSALFSAKTSDFSKFMVCPHRKGELKQCGHFSDKGEGGLSIFHKFVRPSFMDSPNFYDFFITNCFTSIYIL